MIQRLAHSKLVRLFSSAVIDQAMLSAASLLVGLLLIRHTSDADYGHFVLAQSALLLLVSLQGAFIAGPMMVLAPKKVALEKAEMIGALYHYQRNLTQRAALAGFVVVALLALSGRFEPASLMVWAAFVVASWFALNREYLRQTLMVYSRPHLVLRADTVFVLVLVAGSALAAFYTTPASAFAVLSIGAAAYCGSLMLRASVAKDPGLPRVDPKRFVAEITRLGLWATAGASIYWTFSQGYNYLIAVKLDIAAVAAVAATRLLLMPINLLTAGIKQLLIPTAANWHSEFGMAGLLRRLAVFVGGVLMLALIYCALLWWLRDWIMTTVLKKFIADHDALILLWAGIFLISMARDLMMTALYVRERFSSLTWLALASAICALSLATLLMPTYGPRGALIGLLCGESLNILGVAMLLWREARQAAAH